VRAADPLTPRAEPLAVGEVAPDFVLPDSDRRQVRLSEYAAGRIAIVVFYPWAFTGLCTSEMCAIRDRLPELDNDRTATLAISCDATATLRAFAHQEGYSFPLLSDHWPHGMVSQAFGVFDHTMGAALRGTFILSPDRVVLWSVVNGVPNARDIDAYLSALPATA
jgi:mycoredoxin-dependent peroxiredoxin